MGFEFVSRVFGGRRGGHLAATVFLVYIVACLSDYPSFNDSATNVVPFEGAIEGATCRIEQLEYANDSQLHSILHDLTRTNFFKMFTVELQRKCPFWKEGTTSTAGDGPAPAFGEEEEGTGNGEEDAFDCPGSSQFDLAPDAEPLCSLDTGTGGPFGGDSGSGFGSFLPEPSPAPVHSFQYTRPSDSVDTLKAEGVPTAFWADMCDGYDGSGAATIVDLTRNPERNTGYDGSHIWDALYEENCVQMDSGDTCYEEVVLYRLVSGLHTAVTVGTAKHFFPPTGAGGSAWGPSPRHLVDRLAGHPERVRNLYFAYVVMLRALSRAAPALMSYPIHTGDVRDDRTASALLRRLLDSGILSSCSAVFDAFDENAMFDQDRKAGTTTLRTNFKQVFQNITQVLDCVQCQQCKLHSKLTITGYGAALKILFLPQDDIRDSLTRNELVALVNTVAKMSASMRDARELAGAYKKDRTGGGAEPDIPHPLPLKGYTDLTDPAAALSG